MKYLILILMVATFYSCGSNEVKNKPANEFSEIEDKDFAKLKPQILNKSTDAFFERVGNYDSTSSESVSRVPDSLLDDLTESDDKLNEIISRCHKKDFARAFKMIDHHRASYLKHPGFWNAVGSCYLLSGLKRKALLFYNKSREIDSKYAPPYNNLGVLYLRDGKSQKAFTAFKKAGSINPFSLTPQFNLAMLYLRYGFVAKAEELLNSLAMQNDNDIDVISGLAVAKLFKGDYEEAVLHYSKLPANIHRRFDIGINFSVALKKIGRSQDARSLLANLEQGSGQIEQNYFKQVKIYVEKN